MQTKNSKPQFYAILFTDGNIVFNTKKYAKAAEAIGHTKYHGKVSMVMPLGNKVLNSKTKLNLLNVNSGWVTKFGKPVTVSAAKFALVWAKTRAFKNQMAEVVDEGKRVWKKGKVWSVDGLAGHAKSQLKVGQTVMMTFYVLPMVVDRIDALDNREGDRVVMVIRTKKANVIVNGFTAHVI